MNKIKKQLYLTAKAFYYLLPKAIRNQYSDSVPFYKKLIKDLIQRSVGDKLFYYIITDNIAKLTNNFKILSELKDRTSTIKGSAIYPHNEKMFTLPSITENVLDVKIVIFDNVSVIGSTDALVVGDYIFHQELLMMKKHHDLKRFDIFVNFNVEQKQFVAVNIKNVNIYNEKDTIYISLLKEHSINYYHWITENIPRLVLILKELSKIERKEIIKNKKVIFLIDEGMPKQCIEIINLIVPFEFLIREVKKGEMCQCSNLIYCSPFWQSLDNTKGDLDSKEFFVDRYAIELVDKAIKDNVKLSTKPADRKIYLRRKPSQARSILNNEQVEAYMKSNDFEIIETDKMSFVEQVKLFHEAKLVVGASGATFTNILFMQPSTKAIIFYPSHPSVNHGIFQPLADVSEINLIHYKTIAQDMESIHSNFFIDLHKLDKLLNNGEFDAL